MAIPQKLLGGFFCRIPSVLIADISPLSVQDECTRGLFAFFFLLLYTDLVIKEENHLLHTMTKKVLKGNYRTPYLFFFGTIKRYNIAVVSLNQRLSIYRRCDPEVYLD